MKFTKILESNFIDKLIFSHSFVQHTFFLAFSEKRQTRLSLFPTRIHSMHLTAITMEEFPTNLYRLVNLTRQPDGVGGPLHFRDRFWGLGMGTGLVKFLVDPILFGSVRSLGNAEVCSFVRAVPLFSYKGAALEVLMLQNNSATLHIGPYQPLRQKHPGQ